jgi:2-methylcitrate dehydratase PrpD
MVPVGFPNSLGAAAAVGRLLKLDERQMSNALGIAGALAGWCPAEVIFGDGGTVKPMMFGSSPAATGIAAAYYAQKGMAGPPHLFESNVGLFATAARKGNREVLVDRTTWYLAKPRRKMHAACGYLHSALDVVIGLRREGAALRDAAEIRIGMPQYVIEAVSKTRDPVSPNDARFHAQYMLSLAAADPDLGAIVPAHSIEFQKHMKDPAVRDLMRRVKVVSDPGLTHYHQSTVSLVDAAGNTLVRREGKGPRGSPQNPMSDDDVRAKFRQLVAFRLSPAKTEEYLKRMATLETAKDWSWLVNSFQ